jgi:diguanylate cyclase (GGDEF)-like protein
MRRYIRSGADATSRILRQEEQLGDANEAYFRADQKRQAAEKLLEEAGRDVVTGLPVFGIFMENLRAEMKRAERTGKRVAVASGDLNFLKFHNDYGKDKRISGDNYLRGVATAWQAVKRETDTLGKLSQGDEIGGILSDVDPIDDPEERRAEERAIAQRLEAEINPRLQVDANIDHEWPAHFSIGVAIQIEGETPEEFLARAGEGAKDSQGVFKAGLDPVILEQMRQLGDSRFTSPLPIDPTHHGHAA